MFFKEFWESHPDVKTVKWIQARSADDSTESEDDPNISDLSDNEEALEREQESEGSISSDKENSEDQEEEQHVSFASNKFAALSTDD